jgi:hypothetical protein
MRDHARASTVQIAVGMGYCVSLVVGWKVIETLYEVVASCVGAISRLQPAVQISLIAVAAICVFHPVSREKLKHGWNNLKNSGAFLTLGDVMGDFAVQVLAATEKTKANYQIVEAALPARQKRPLLMHARAVCTAAAAPQSLAEQIRRGGYVSRSQTFRPYLRRILRADSSFLEVAGGWMISSTGTSEENTVGNLEKVSRRSEPLQNRLQCCSGKRQVPWPKPAHPIESV